MKGKVTGKGNKNQKTNTFHMKTIEIRDQMLSEILWRCQNRNQWKEKDASSNMDFC